MKEKNKIMNNIDCNIKLCEDLGIEPLYGLIINFGDLDNNYHVVTDRRKYPLIAKYRWSVDNEDELRNMERNFYPDITKGENVVRILNKLYEYKIVLCVEYDENEPTFVNAFIKKLKRVVKTYHLSKILNEIEWEFN